MMVYLHLHYPYRFLYKLWIGLFPPSPRKDMVSLLLRLLPLACPELIRPRVCHLGSHHDHCVEAQKLVERAASPQPAGFDPARTTSVAPLPAMGGNGYQHGGWQQGGKGGRGKGGWQPRAPYQPYQPPSGGGGFGGFASITN
eukprot:8767646-Pyramimonas_sp.AAC.1